MKIWVNGESAEARGASDIAELVARYDLPAKAVLVEHNGLALRPDEWSDRRLEEGDRVEIIRIVAGG